MAAHPCNEGYDLMSFVTRRLTSLKTLIPCYLLEQQIYTPRQSGHYTRKAGTGASYCHREIDGFRIIYVGTLLVVLLVQSVSSS